MARLRMTFLLGVLLLLVTTTCGAPAVLPNSPTSNLTKRHDYTLICKSEASFGKFDDIPLTKRCVEEPYKYRCDGGGEPDIASGGKTDPECDRKCECKNIGTNPKPMCIGLLGYGSISNCI